MVICAGPTGSGKTTTLYASLTRDQRAERNITTIEDPVEYVFPSINQIQINEQAGVTFASGLRSILRQDPDVILVGEIRDAETARIAVQSALTGHFVLSSLHATDAVSALHRFLDMGIEPFLVASSVLRRRRPAAGAPDPAATAGSRTTPTAEELAFYDDVGGVAEGPGSGPARAATSARGTGYSDRVGVYELLAVTEEIEELWCSAGPARRDAPAGACAGHAHAAGGGASWSRTTSPRSPRSCGIYTL